MADKEELKRAFKAFKKRLKLYQADSGSSAPASHLSREKHTISAIAPPDQYPKEIWDELVAKGKLKDAGRGMYELNS